VQVSLGEIVLEPNPTQGGKTAPTFLASASRHVLVCSFVEEKKKKEKT
jgi:hypothetical protein